MSKFVYTLKDDNGRDYEGSIEAKDKREAQAALDTKGYYLTSLREVPQLQLSIMPKKVTRKDAIVFAQQMGTMLGTGLPIQKSLSAIAEQSDNEMMRTVINDIRAKIEAGFKLSDAMDKYPNVFSPFFVSLVRTGEASGAMDEAFKTLSSYMEREEEIKRKVKSAFAYPIIVGVILLCVVTFLLMNVVPRFQDFYDSMKVELPGPTVMLLAASHFIREQWLIAILGTVGMVVGFILFKKQLALV